MKHNILPLLFLGGLGSLSLALGVAQTAPTPSTTNEQGLELFEKRIRPLFHENCVSCHGEKQQMGQLRLDNRTLALKGGERGVVIMPWNPEKSLLIEAVRYHTPRFQMPPKGKLSEADITLLIDWIKQGAVWTPDKTSKPSSPASTGIDVKLRAQHWSFRPVRQVNPPAVKNQKWVKNPIDAFVLAKLEAKGMTPASPTDRYSLLRRVTYDLTGLPPTPAEIRAFMADTTPNAYEKVVERLLASPHYGERWARHWLDLVRFAETDGHEFDFVKPGAYQYRDYVIRAFNADVPYNQFVREQIAGDMLATPRIDPKTGSNESLLGTGFWWLGEGKHSPVDLRVDQAERTDNQIDVMGRAFLGLSLGCVRCHDHKFDPITQKDYYGLAGIVNSTRYHLLPATSPTLQKQVQELALQSQEITREFSALLPPTLTVRQKALQGLEGFLLGGKTGTRLTSTQAAPSKWQKFLTDTASKDPRAFWYPWAILSQTPERDFAKVKADLLKQYEGMTESAKRITQAQTLYADFSSSDMQRAMNHYNKWTRTGEAFHNALVPVAVEIGQDAPEIKGVFGFGIVDSGRISDRLTGAMRSPTFSIPKKFIHYRAAGNACAIRLIIDGFQRIQFPIYGNLRTAVNGLSLQWYTQDVTKWVGHNAYIEVTDYSEGRIALQKVAFSDTPETPNTPNTLLAQHLAKANSLAELAKEYSVLLNQPLLDKAHTELEADGFANTLNSLLRELPEPLTTTQKAEITPALKQTWEQWRDKSRQIPISEQVQVAQDGTGVDERIQLRGNPKSLGTLAPRRFLEALSPSNQGGMGAGCGRMELAQRMLSPVNPLVTRVFVNRLWHYHFGTGIVKTTDDFGLRTDRPAHLDLLDWLATTLVREKWSVKQMHRLMLLSNTYRMSSKLDPAVEAKDPTNQLWHRMPVKRLEAEAIRDGILAVSGRLDRKLFGPSVLPYLTPFMEGRGRPASGPLDSNGRRSIYISVRRNFLTPMFLAFDYPIPFNSMGRRSVSNVPAQALVLMNNPLVVDMARYWAEELLKDTTQTAEQRVQAMYLSALGRPAQATEIQTALQFLQAQKSLYENEGEVRAWQDLCHVLFNVKEFIFLQ